MRCSLSLSLYLSLVSLALSYLSLSHISSLKRFSSATLGFDESSLESFVSTNPLVVDLKLSELGRLTRDSARFLYPLGRHGQLRRLDLSRWGTPQGTVLEDEDVIDLLREVGRELDELNLDGTFPPFSLSLSFSNGNARRSDL